MAELKDRAAQEQDKWNAYYAGLGEVEETPAVEAFGGEFTTVMQELLPAGATVLEAGCGAGFQSLALARTGRYRVSMMDISPEALQAAHELFGRNGLTADSCPGDVFEPGEPAHDLVFNAGVLEHYTLDQQAAFLRGMASRTKKFVLVLVPNRLCYWYWLWRVKQSQIANWPFGKECPMADMADAFRNAGLTFLGRTFLASVWTEDLIANVDGMSAALCDEMLAIHRSGFIDPAQRCYLTAALGCIGDAPAELPSRWSIGPAGDEMRTAEITASLADALALRLSAEFQLRDSQKRIQALDVDLSEAKAELAAFRSFRSSGIYRLAVRLHNLRVKIAPPHSWRAKSARKLVDGARATIRPVSWLTSQIAARVHQFSDPLPSLGPIIARIAASGKRPVIFLPSLAWTETLFQRPHHLAREFARLGHVVVFDCTGTGDSFVGLKEAMPNLFLYGGETGHLRALENPILWTFSYNFQMIDGFPPGTTAVYDWIDDLSVFPHDQITIRRIHDRAMGEAAVVTAVASRLHREALASRSDAIYLPNAAEYDRFSDPSVTPAADPRMKQLAETGRPIAGYYGALARWFDFELLKRVADRRKDWQFVLIGPDLDGSTTGQEALQRPNVLWLGPRDYRTLPGYLKYFDVATIPFVINDITRATSPLKLYEYFSAGKPVITTAMPECMAFPEVHIARTASDFARALDAAHAEGGDQEFRQRLRRLGESNSWAARVREVAALLEPTAIRRAA